MATNIKRGQTGSKALGAAITAAGVLPSRTVAQLTGEYAAAKQSGRLIRLTNGNAGQPCLAYSDGTNWKVVALGANAAVS